MRGPPLQAQYRLQGALGKACKGYLFLGESLIDHPAGVACAEDWRRCPADGGPAWNAADLLQSGAITAKNCSQILMDNEARTDQP